MKKLLLVPLLAAIALFVQPVLAEDARQPEKAAQAAQGGTAGPDEKMSAHESMMQESMNKMQAQMATIHQTKDPKKRLKLLQEHRKSMRDSIKMMRETMGGMAKGCPMMGGGHMMGGHMMGGHMMGGMKCPMMGGNPAGQAGQAGSNPDAASAAQAGQAAAGKTTAGPEGKVWTCPMHPEVVRDQPGLCPICGMELVEKGQAGAAQPGQSHAMGGCMMGGGMKCPMMGGTGCPMTGMGGKHMDMMLMLMEQMIEHDEAAMAARK